MPGLEVCSGPWLSRWVTKLRFGAEGPAPGWLRSVAPSVREAQVVGSLRKWKKSLQTELKWGRQMEASGKDALQDTQGSRRLSAPQRVHGIQF